MGEFSYKDNGLYFSANDTIVFWNFDDYPITVPADIVSIHRNIKSALHQMGFENLVYIEAYGDKLRQDTSALKKAGILYTQEEDAALVMALDIVNTTLAYQVFDNPLNVVVIAKQSPKSELNRVLHCLESRNNPVLLVEPPDDTAQDSLFHSVQALVDCTHLLGGEKAISIRPTSYAYDHDDAFRWRECIFEVE